MQYRKTRIQTLCMISLMVALMAVTAQIFFPMPIGVPMTLQTFAIMLTGIVLGPKSGTIATVIYLLLGLIGLPVFSNFTGGYQCFIGPAGGFLLTFPILVLLAGLGRKGKLLPTLILGNLVNLAGGMFFYCLVYNVSIKAGFFSMFLPFLPATILKIVLAIIVGKQLIKLKITQ